MKKLFIYSFLILALHSGLSAQTITTVGTSSVDYGTLKDAFDAINAGDLKGDVVLKIIDNTVEYGTAVLYGSGLPSNYTSVTIYPTDPGLTISRAVAMTNELLIDLNGADNVTFDGRVNAAGTTADLTITNTFAGASASTIRFTNSAQNNTIRYCNIKGSDTNTSGGILLFSTSGLGTGNDGNTIDRNNITGSASGRPLNTIFSSGTNTRENSGNSISNNNISDFLNNAQASTGIYLSSYTTGWTIAGNSFFETSSFGPVTSVPYNIIKIDNTAGDGFVVSGNYIGGSSALCNGAPWTKINSTDNTFCSILVNAGAGITSSIQNNTIKNFSWSNSGNSSFTGIETNAGNVNIGTSVANNIGETSGVGSIFFKGTSANTEFFGIKITSPGTVDCRNNNIGSVIATNYGAASSTNFYGIIKTASGGTTTISDNVIGSTLTSNSINANSQSTGNIQTVYGISNSGTGSITINGNTIANLTNGTTNSAAGTAGRINGICSTDGTITVSNNTIRNLSIANANTSTANTASVVGMALSGALPVAANNNKIYNLANTNNSFAGNIVGLYFGGGTGLNSVEGSFIHDLSVTGAASTMASIYGILIASGTSTYSNNIVSIGGNTQTTIYGIYETGTIGNNNNLYFNTVYINGVPTAGAKNSFSIYSAVTTNTRNFRNNLFYNARSNNTATGKHYSVYFVSSGGTLTINYNDYFTNGTGGTLGYFAADITTLAAWKAATGQDANSLDIDPSFVNAGGSSATDFMLAGPILTGITGTGIIYDYNDASRKNPPTMGAFEVGCTDPVSGGTIAADQNGCSPFDAAEITSTETPSGYAGAIEWKWQQSIISDISGFTDISSTNTETYNPGLLTQTTWFKRVARVACKSDWAGAAESNVVKITVNNLPTAGTITGGTVFCLGSILTLTPAASGAAPLTYTWSSSAGGIASVTNAGVVSGIAAGSSNITYTVTDAKSCSATSPVHGVTVNALPATGLTVGGGGTICSGTATIITVALSVTGINYQLRNDNADELIGTVISGTDGTTISLPTGILTTNTTFNVLAINAVSSCAAELTQKATVSITPPSSGGSITGTAVITYGSSTGTMTLSGYLGTIVRWEKQLNSGVWTTISNTSNTYSETPSSAGTWSYRAVVQNGSCAIANSSEFSITVNKAALSVTAADKSKTYDGVVFSAFTVTYSGFVLGETSAVLGGSLTFSGTATTIANAGNYVITPGGLTSGNYNITFINGQLTISTAPLSITATDKNKVYDGLVFSPFTVTYSGFVNGETSTVLGSTLTFSGTATAATTVGSYVITPAGLTSGNYAITFVNGQLTITKAPLSAIASDKSKTYDGSVFSPFTETYSGFVNGETSSVLGGTLTFSGTATTAINAGSYVITPAGLTSANYNITFTAGQLIIDKAPLTVIADDKSKVYDGLVYTGFTGTYTGFVNSETVTALAGSLTYSGTATTATGAGSYVITPGGFTAINYSISFVNGQLTINKAPLTITAANKSKVYNGSVFTQFTVTYSGFVNNETAGILTGNITFGGTATTGINAGNYIITPGGQTSGNYTITFVDGQLTVTKANLTFTADNKSRIYQAQNPVLTFTITGFTSGETQTVLDFPPVLQTTAVQASPVGSYPITLSGGSDNNYSYILVSGTLTIDKMPQTVTFTSVPARHLVMESYTLVASSSSGNTVLFSGSDNLIATVAGNQLTGVSKGNVQIRAYNSGDANHEAGEVFATVEIYSTHKDIMHLFTPNGDGINDQWELPDLATWGKCDVRIYNRWGVLIFADQDYQNLWDGTFDGSAVPEGAYYFIIKTENAGNIMGTVNVVR